jgi:hypothetical protein
MVVILLLVMKVTFFHVFVAKNKKHNSLPHKSAYSYSKVTLL